MRAFWGTLVSTLLFFAGVLQAADIDFKPAGCSDPERSRASWLACHAPTFRVLDGDRPYNRIGTPELSPGWWFGPRARVDPDTAAMYVERRTDRVANRDVLQLVYRVHFEKIPFRFSRYFFEAHRNPGLIVMLTLDRVTGEILFVSTVHTCGCYYVVIPTDAVPREWLPEGHSESQTLYGQQLPGMLGAEALMNGLSIVLESRSHRVADVRTGSLEPADETRAVPLVPMAQLDSLPIRGQSGEVGSFFYQSGPLAGHVRGAWNMFEGLTVFGWLSLDPTVGMDKKFGDPEKTGTPFYTLLPFWLHERSRMDRMDSLLRVLGYRLPVSDDSNPTQHSVGSRG